MLIVTGAGGWIGGRLLETARETGREALRADAIDVASGRHADLPWRDASVVHLAGIAHRRAVSVGSADYRRVNCELALDCARAAAAGGARRFVFVSTAAVMGTCSPGRPWREDDPPAPADPYAASKWAAEEALSAFQRTGAIEVVVLRPPLVWGPGVRANFLALLRWACSPWPLPFGRARAPRSMAYIDHVADALLHLARTDGVAGRTFFVADDVDRSVAQWIEAVRLLEGRPPRLLDLPPQLVRMGAAVVGRPGAYDRLYGESRVSAAALRATGWSASSPFEVGLRRTLTWFRGARP